MLDNNKAVLIRGPEIAVANEIKAEGKDQGRYLYCVAQSSVRARFGKIGLDGKEVYTIPFVDLCAVVHNCPPEPYKSEDNEMVKKWVVAHEKVVEAAWERFGTVLPAGFDTIIKGEEGISPEENIKNWLGQDYERLKEKMDKIRDKAEYGIQVFWDPKLAGDEIASTNEGIKSLNQKIESKPKGIAYMLKRELENLLKKEMEKQADLCFRDFYARIKNRVDEIRVEKTKKIEEEKQMLMNLSCLAGKERAKELGGELEKIKNKKGFTVRFTGPWPPYSFVGLG